MSTTIRISFITPLGDKFDNGRFHVTRFMTHSPKYVVMGCHGSIHISVDNTRHSYPLDLPMLHKDRVVDFARLPESLCRVYFVNKYKLVLYFTRCWPEDGMDDIDDNYACYKLSSLSLD